jgi:hypothetical protein
MENLSWEAKGLWSYLLSRPPNWEPNIAHLTTHFPSGKDRLYRIFQELEGVGLCSKTQERLPNGFMGKFLYTIYEDPQLNKRLPHTENPLADNPLAENPTHNKDREKIKTDDDDDLGEKTPKVPCGNVHNSPHEVTKKTFKGEVLCCLDDFHAYLARKGISFPNHLIVKAWNKFVQTDIKMDNWLHYLERMVENLETQENTCQKNRIPKKSSKPKPKPSNAESGQQKPNGGEKDIPRPTKPPLYTSIMDPKLFCNPFSGKPC